MMRRSVPTFVMFIVLSINASLAQTNPAAPDDKNIPNIVFPREQIQNLGRLKNDLKSYHDCTCTCGCYSAEIEEQADRALRFLQTRVKEAKSAERLAIVLDIDETTLSNYDYYIRHDFAYEPQSWDEWVKQAQATAISGTLRIFRGAQAHNVAVFFITGRSQEQGPATEKNLRSAGFENWTGLTLRSAEQKSLSTTQYKSAARQKIVDQGFRIVLNVGDQLSDLEGVPFAELSLKIPDPFYYIQ